MDRVQLALVYGLLSQALQEPDAQYVLRLRESIGQLPVTLWEDAEIPLASLVSAMSHLTRLSIAQLQAEYVQLFYSPEPAECMSAEPIWRELAAFAHQLAGQPAEIGSNNSPVGVASLPERLLGYGQHLSAHARLLFYQACGHLLIALAHDPLITATKEASHTEDCFA